MKIKIRTGETSTGAYKRQSHKLQSDNSQETTKKRVANNVKPEIVYDDFAKPRSLKMEKVAAEKVEKQTSF